eukprot:2005049-Lingulodinium_polyedra.AAC.1
MSITSNQIKRSLNLPISINQSSICLAMHSGCQGPSARAQGVLDTNPYAIQCIEGDPLERRH